MSCQDHHSYGGVCRAFDAAARAIRQLPSRLDPHRRTTRRQTPSRSVIGSADVSHVTPGARRSADDDT
ncbi:hypothetical protein MSMEI_3385 [Mycolicibacterium smegmatis MC2 155]|uniref:Uncharacterized protein n=1 Tax=Mycolicibacterium smegmatis (strain ATCC 700084 / mc(2)155) TaxID=246196 RepID=I7FMB4_MYCS2|nr:hypothetical protein MSMEI_3385 [Mycolicibacterium smegmatis MC2 155]